MVTNLLPTAAPITRHRFEVRDRMRQIWLSQDKEIVVSGPAGTGKTRQLLELFHMRLARNPMSRVLLARQTRQSMTQTCLKTFNNEVLKKEDRVKWSAQDQCYYYPNKSEMVVSGLDDPQKVMSGFYDIVYVNEVVDIKLEAWADLMSRLRNFKMKKMQIFGDCNPQAPTHWIKQRAQGGLLRLFEMSHEDNPVYYDGEQWTPQGADYLETLDSLPGFKRLRLRYGIWAAAEGLIFEEWNRDVHVLEPFKLDTDWNVYWVVDFGYHPDPFVWQKWVEVTEDMVRAPFLKAGDLVMVKEIYQTKRLVEEHARLIRSLEGEGARPDALICDHDGEGRATLEKHLGVLTTAAYKRIQDGLDNLQVRLGKPSKGVRPTMYFVEGATVSHDHELKEKYLPISTVEEMAEYMWDPKRPDQPIDAKNHGIDCTRYLGAYVDGLAVDPQDREETVFLGEEAEVRISRY
jgi:hypothetical protein